VGGLAGTGGKRSPYVGTLLASIFVFGAALGPDVVPPLTPPLPITDGIVINIPQRMLFVAENGTVVAHYPVGLGLATWPTFIGPFTIAVKEVDPVWDVPPSIQEEMRRAGKPVLTRVPPGPRNPLGKHWLGLSVPGFGIHGTIAPTSVGKFATHGCIRMRADDVADLFARVDVGTQGMSIYEPVIVNVSDEAVWVEAHRDAYGHEARDAYEWVVSESKRLAPHLTVDVETVRRVLTARDGRPHRVDVYSTAWNISLAREYLAVETGR
jgi:L,D-transpeptidase ErfK/SrfK